MSVSCKVQFERRYEAHLKHLRLRGLQPKTIEAYAGAERTVGAYFEACIDDLSEQQLLDYFTDRLATCRISSRSRRPGS